MIAFWGILEGAAKEKSSGVGNAEGVVGRQAVLDTVQVTVFGQSKVVSAGAMADTFFVASLASSKRSVSPGRGYCELRIGCRFSTDFCARHENQTNIS